MSTYKCISNFGQGAANAPSDDPLTYCLSHTINNEFIHGAMAETISSASSKNCQAFMGQRCANNWDDACEYASTNQSGLYPN